MVTADDVRDAWSHLRGIVHPTPMLQSRSLDEMAGGRVFLKMESFQRAGAFKFRGAFHALTRNLEQAREAGVVTGSSGNHGGALALAGKILGVSVTVVVPEDIRAVKREALDAYGATVEVVGRTSVERLSRARELADTKGMLLVHPYDDPHVIAGQGTVAMEVLEQVPDLDVFVAPVGGGGLLSGCATYINDEMASVEVWGA
ncbi:MAG TPA: pyridoxal-phosphate dependent enzyme, partial [Planctomycetota bacterium]|nr:pyridoxal-phosphate dependent enzyme [Planctomycetota bacterium]